MASPSSVLASSPARELIGPRLTDVIRERSSTLGTRRYIEHARADRGLSFRSLERSVASWATRFEGAGVADGATVGLVYRDPIELATAFLATIASGRWAAPFDPATPLPGAGGLVASVTRVRADIVLSDQPRPEGIDVGWLATGGWDAPEDGAVLNGVRPTSVPASSGGAVLASSGTTGVPKVIVLHQLQLLHAARCVADHHALSPGDRGFNPLPLFHVNAEVVGILATLVAGSTLVLDDRFHRTDFWALMAHHRITWINAVPAIISRLAEPDRDEIIPAHIRFIRSASAPLRVDTLRAFESATAIPVVETYGMTEAASQITANPMMGLRKPGSVGLPIGVELRIVPLEDARTEVPPPYQAEPVGHVEIRGPSVITSYGGDLHRDRFDVDGWLRTGDLGHFDEDGYLYLDARSDDVINRGGEKIFPGEIEELLLGDSDIAAVSIVGEPDPVFGQVPVAYLVIRGVEETSNLGQGPAIVERIRQHLESTLVRSRRPVSLRIVRELPAGATGKVQRRALREEAVPVLHRLDCQ
jgi:acyl-CoA synthetase (AMP-forming)/AMP-acid ligase II